MTLGLLKKLNTTPFAAKLGLIQNYAKNLYIAI